ncbi:MAG TPA: helix-turn-helix domain-containing protein [Bacteroidia bacterium]|nr:HTH-type transcriptional activator RhaR [Bacteroidia bacterium]MBX3106753.1 AraC family transcriptional regulator [Bacteroidota bacterium]MCB0848676.1 AraC family transcriptional regulator [Bacteroidota bacterium]MCB8929484.1 AraC family transcriptional regulator [Bacteroidia bacterium]MCO5288927.1 helix-turn-helix domain-containing protein [Bacteroidota bacterium]
MKNPKSETLHSSTENFFVLTLDFSKGIILDDLIARSNVRNDFFIFVLFADGEAGAKINLKKLNLKKNDLLIIPPDAAKERVYISKDAVLKIVAYTSEFISQLNLPDRFWEATDYYSTRHKPVWTLPKPVAKNLVNLIHQMEARISENNQHPFKMEIVKYIFMIFILELAALAPHYALENNQQFTRKELLTIEFYALAKKHFREHRELKYYADALFVTSKHLTETVKEVSKRTAGETIDSLLAQAAKIQLKTTSKSIAEISDALNFSDQSSFGKFFKRMEGVSPKTYRSNQ